MKKRALKITAFFIAICLLFKLMDFLFVPVMFDHWANHDRKLNESKIDTVVLGDSLGMYCFQPKIYNEKFNANSYNASSAGQTTLDSFFLMRDFIKSMPNLKKVVMLADYYVFFDDLSFDVFWINNIILSRIEDIPLKVEYYRKTNTLDNLYKFIVKKNLYKFNYKDIADNIKAKTSYEYRHYGVMTQSGNFYSDNGYICVYSENSSPASEASTVPLNNEAAYQYFEMLITLCNDNGIELTVVQSPITANELDSIYYYDNYHRRISDICQKNNIDFWDFNKYNFKNKLDPVKDFKDNNHLNYYGSCKFMELLCNVLSGDKDSLERFDR